MKNILIFTAIFLMFTVCYSQTETNNNSITSVIEKDYLKGLHKPTDEEKKNLNLQLTPNIDFYTDNGNKTPFKEVLPLIKSGNYSLTPYINDSNEIKVVILKPKSVEEKKEGKKRLSKKNKKIKYVGKYAKPFNVTDIKGNKYSLEELKGKIIILNFWFIECKPCVKEIPDLNKLVEKYNGEEIVFLGFAINKMDELNYFLDKNEFKYNIIAESKEVINNYKIKFYPTHIVIDKNSKIVFSAFGLGPNTLSDLENEIEKLLKE